MPENLTVGFFVLGAVLILIALVGGKFKIFVAEVSPAVNNPFIRAISFILGIAFIFLSLFPDVIAGAGAEPMNPPPTIAVESPQPGPQPVVPGSQSTQAFQQPTPIDTPVPVQPSPTEFLASYWQNVSSGKFESAWPQLSPRFRQIMHNDDYTDYVRGYQEMTLCHIVVSNLNLIQQDNSSAVVIGHFTYYTGPQCNASEYDFEMGLVYDGVSNSWLFDRNILR